MAVKRKRRISAAHKRTKKIGALKRRLKAKIRRTGLSKMELKKYSKAIDYEADKFLGDI